MAPLDLIVPEAPAHGREPTPNAYVELHNLIAAAESLAGFGPADRDRISRQCGVDLRTAFLRERLALYTTVLDHRLSNGDLDGDDRAVLAHLADTLALGGADLRPAHERAFGVAVLDALSDDCLAVEERLLLLKLQHTLGLDPRVADGAYEVLARERVLKTIARALCDGALSPEEEEEIEATAAALSVSVPAEVEAMLDAARVRWQVRKGEVAANVSVPLAGGESGRFEARASWQAIHPRRLLAWAGYAAVQSGRTAGLVLPQSVFRGVHRTGRVAITDRRLVLTPERGLPDTVALDKVEQTLRFRNGTVIRESSGRYRFVDVADARDDFYRHLYHAVNGADDWPPD